LNYKSCYQDNERILIIQDSDDCYDFDINNETPGKALIFLQKALQKLDISNFFVLIISGNPDLNDEVNSLQNIYSTDDNCIQTFNVNLPYNKKIQTADTFCVVPWVHLYNATDAKIYPCCWGDFDEPFGNLLEQPIDTIINNEKFKSIRKNMLSNRKNKTCENCYLLEKSSSLSRRQQINKKYENIIPTIKENTNSDGSIENFNPNELHLSLNNTCNLKCQTCSGYSSSKLAYEEKLLYNYTNNFDRTLDKNQTNQVLNYIIPYLSTVKEIDFAGGEPTIQIEHYRVLDKLLELGCIDTLLKYNINCTKLGVKNYNIIDYWKKFPNIRVSASLDGIKEKFEYVRSGANWTQVENNFKIIKKECPHITLKVNSVISFISLESVIQLQKYWHTNNILDINNFQISLMLKNSGYFDIQSLPKKHKQRLDYSIQLHCQWLTQVGADKLVKQWQEVIDYMHANDLTYILPECLTNIKLKDKFRQQDFFSVFPEFVDVFEI